MRFGGGIGDAALNLWDLDTVGQERERDRDRIRVLHFQALPGDCRPIEARRCAGLQSTHPQARVVEAVRQTNRRRIADPSGGNALFSAVDHALQKRSGGQHHPARAVFVSGSAHDACHDARVDDQVLNRLGPDRQVGRGRQLGLHGLPVELAVDLSPWASHRRAFGAIEQAELDAGLVGQPAHQAVEGVDLANQVTLAQAADGRVAAHLADRLELVRQQQGARAEPR